MSYASKLGQARINARSPEAAAICQRCGFVYNRVDIRYQYDWTGTSLTNLRILVCGKCYDSPQEQNRSIVIAADPVPIVNPSPEFYQLNESDYLTLTPATKDPVTGLPIPNATMMTTVSGRPMIDQPIGIPSGYVQASQSPLVEGIPYATALPTVSILSSGGNTIVVTTATPHWLSTGSQVGVQGVLSANAAGAFSVIVSTPTQFTYLTNKAVPAGSQRMANTLVTTMNIGVPLNMDQLPQTGS